MVTRESAIKDARSFIHECKKNGVTFYKAILFGSAAKDEMHEWSDFDLLLLNIYPTTCLGSRKSSNEFSNFYRLIRPR